MNEQTLWMEKAIHDTKECWKSYISSRVEFALERISRNPEYIKLCEQQEKDQEVVDSLLKKLGDENALTVRRHYEMETTRQSFEIDEAYMQGMMDAIQFLGGLGIFQAKEWMK